MKIIIRKTKLIAIATEDGEKGTLVKVGDSMGTMDINTGKFYGMTACMLELSDKLRSMKQQ